MARHAGISHCTVQRIWSKNELSAHYQDVQAVERPEVRGEVLGRIGLYLDPPAKALVLCCKAQGTPILAM
jgi:hypothetical protein